MDPMQTRREQRRAVAARSGTTRSRWVRPLLVGAGFPAAGGVLAGVLLPRGPVSSAQALGMLAGATALGLLVGAVARQRWTMASSPLAFAVAYELVRAPAVGPTVDGIHLTTPYGVLAFLVGRGVLTLVALVPMVLGIQVGVALATGGRTPPARATGRVLRSAGWALTVGGAVTVLGLAALLARPASTPAIVGSDGAPVPGSVAALETVELGGQLQSILVRGRSRDAPVLLYLAGGPGQSDLPLARVLLADLERDFVVVSWDQRGGRGLTRSTLR